jgi:hypothetical protein
MENPYAAPSTLLSPPDERRRPFGVTMLAVLTGIIGLIMLAAFVVLVIHWRENNQVALQQRMAPSVLWFAVGLCIAPHETGIARGGG